jgi:Fic family protein
MSLNTRFSQRIPVFHGRTLPEKGSIVGYAAIIEALELPVPIPETIAVISVKNKRHEKKGWKIFTPKHHPDETLYKQLVFSLKYEGINLLVFKILFKKLSKQEILDLIQIEPTGQYSRKIWFLYEWLNNEKLNIPDLSIKSSIPLVDEKLQYAIEGTRSPRHRIINNLPGTPGFCPLIFKTKKLEHYINSSPENEKVEFFNRIHKEVLQRTSTFLLLKDSKASFTIEGESPGNKRAMRWGKAIGQAGSIPLSKEEFLRLQQVVIENSRFTTMGFRKKGGFVGDHDRTTGEPLPDHISARWQDAEQLTERLIETSGLLESSGFDPVLSAAEISFGFVFIHPFSDGNGRIHRYIIHHILSKMKFGPQGIIFPVSASILDHINDYRKILESYSQSIIEFIDWKATSGHNVKILNETIDYYRYFDATKQAEFLYDCVMDTIDNIIPAEVNYLMKYDRFKHFLDNNFEMPDKIVALLVRFLEQNNGSLSNRAKNKEFIALKKEEITAIENKFIAIFTEE